MKDKYCACKCPCKTFITEGTGGKKQKCTWCQRGDHLTKKDAKK